MSRPTSSSASSSSSPVLALGLAVPQWMPRWTPPWVGGPRRWVAALVLVALAIAGVWLWQRDYAARLRPEAPDLSTFPASLLVDPAYDYALWLPWPHQNLDLAEEATGPLRDWLAAAAVLGDAPVPTLPSFGFFSLPPARELVLVADSDSHRSVAAARVLPPVAWLARLSGRLAGNPWLTGGEVDLRDRRATVSWEGGVWVARIEPVDQESPLRPPRGDDDEPEAGGDGPVDEATNRVPPPAPEVIAEALAAPALAVFRSGREEPSLPAGLYRLTTETSGAINFERVSSEPLAPALNPLPMSLVSPPGALAGLGAGAPGEGQLHAFSLFAPEAERAGFALLNARPARRLPLQGLGLAVLLGEDGYSGQARGWYVMASGPQNFERGSQQVSLFADWLSAAAGEGQRPRFALVARPDATLAALADLQTSLDAVGPASRDAARRLRALRRLLQPLTFFPRATVTVSDNPVAYRLRLEVEGDEEVRAADGGGEGDGQGIR